MADTAPQSNNKAVVFRGRPERERAMPWNAESFAGRHNHKLTKTPAVAKKAAEQATAMVGSGVDEGVAIATANKHANKLIGRLRKKGAIGGSNGRTTRLANKYGGNDQTPIDAASR